MSKKTDKTTKTQQPQSTVKTKFHSNDKAKSKNPNVNDKEHGQTLERYEGGAKKRKTKRVRGKKHGADTHWRETGRISQRVMWKDGKKHGLEIAWWDNGQKESESMWKDGKRHGISRMWGEDGFKWSEAMWREGTQHGGETWWDRFSQKKIENYIVDSKESACIDWDEKGTISVVYIPKTIAKPIPNTALKSKAASKNRKTQQTTKKNSNFA